MHRVTSTASGAALRILTVFLIEITTPASSATLKITCHVCPTLPLLKSTEASG